MSLYQFPPVSSFGIGTEPLVYWENGFNDEDIRKIIEIGESRLSSSSSVGSSDGGDIIPDVRISKTSWIDLQDDSTWLYDKIAYIINTLNAQYYMFDIYGFNEHMQFTVYDGDENGHYDWHLDSGKSDMSPRKLSFVLQLSDPEEYEGGELQLLNSSEPANVRKEKGFAVVFPSYTLHRVTPVTKGVRKTLVIWVTGPTFK